MLAGRSRTQVNRKVARGRKDLAVATPCTIFSPEDLALVSGGPRIRREMLDDALGLIAKTESRAFRRFDAALRQHPRLAHRQLGAEQIDHLHQRGEGDQHDRDDGEHLLVPVDHRVREPARGESDGSRQPVVREGVKGDHRHDAGHGDGDEAADR